MKLYGSTNSPYVRLVRALLREAGAEDRVAEVWLNPRDPATGFHDVNPVARIPALALEDGAVLTESTLICRHLDDALAGGRMHAPLADPARLALYGLTLGALDRGVAARTEQLRDGAPDGAAFVRTQLDGAARALDALERAAPGPDGPDMVDLAVCCTVEWLAFRHPELDPLSGRPRLADWTDRVGARPALAATRPA